MLGISSIGAVALAVTFLPGATEVVVDRKAPPATRFASEELTNVLSQAFGEAVPLVSRFTKGRTAIVVGTNADGKETTLAGTQGPKCEAGVPASRLPAGDVPYTLELRTRLGSVRGFFDGVLKH